MAALWQSSDVSQGAFADGRRPWKKYLSANIQEVVSESMVRNREENQKEGKPIQWIRVVISIGYRGFGGGCSLGGPPPLHMHPGLCMGWMYPCGQRKPREVCATAVVCATEMRGTETLATRNGQIPELFIFPSGYSRDPQSPGSNASWSEVGLM